MVLSTLRAGPVPTLTGSDIRIIEQGASTLPGNWYLDPVVDLKRWGKPRVWVRKKTLLDSDMLAVSFERIGTVIWVSIHFPSLYQSSTPNGLPFDTFSAAFTYLWARLEARATEVIAPDGLVWRFSSVLHGPLESIPTPAALVPRLVSPQSKGTIGESIKALAAIDPWRP
jgi:hypothetical protein